MVNSISCGLPLRIILTFTFVPPFPLSLAITSLFFILIPATFFPSTSTTLSPAFTPTFSDGPPGITATTHTVSFTILNSTPMPSKFPCKGAFVSASSSAVIYAECGSRFCSIEIMVLSTSLFGLMVSTYCSVTNFNISSILLEPPVPSAAMFPSFLLT